MGQVDRCEWVDTYEQMDRCEWVDRWDRWIDVNGWTDGTGGTGGQKRQMDRCEQVHRGDR